MAPPGGAGEAAGRTLGKRLARPLGNEEAEEGSRCPQGASTPYSVLPGPGEALTDLEGTASGQASPPARSARVAEWEPHKFLLSHLLIAR